jgi:hypothetical protein
MAHQASTQIILSDEEIFDTSLSTFCTFDRENVGTFPPGRNLRGGPCDGALQTLRNCGDQRRACGGGRGLILRAMPPVVVRA